MTPRSPSATPNHERPRRRGHGARRRSTVLCAAAFAGLSVAGCSNGADRAVATAAMPVDYHQRHPVVLAEMPATLDVFLVAGEGSLDYRQKHDVGAFAAEFRAEGHGRIRVLVPHGQVDARAVDATLLAVRRGLVAAGVRGAIEVGSYAVADPRLASVLRLSFDKLQARSATRCGEWPDNLGPSSSFGGWTNESYYNFGCASQQTLAAQVDDPRDLVRPRAEEPGDVQMRTRAIGDLRGDPVLVGTDPSTDWRTPLTQVGGR